jgi:arylsulfatase A-like enzyme
MAVAGTYRRSLFTHTPRRLAYRVRVPEGGRLHMALGVLSIPVEFRVTAQNGGDETATIFRETHGKPDEWAERTVDLSAFAGDTITLGLETDAASAGAIAFWGSPTVSSARRSEKPNVIFYVIDGGWADDMSVYGYNRRTTPNLERLASDGVVFEHAYSNAGWTKPSTASFMTSLHNSVLGNTSPDPVDPLPIEAVTMAEHFHRAGYQTAVFTSNPNAGTVSGLQRGADLLEEPGVLKTEGMNDMTSSVTLHNQFWAWREQTGTPYWVHVQPTDVHAYEGGQPEPVVPFSGLFVTTARRREFFDEWARFNKQKSGDSTQAFYSGGLEAAGIDRGGFFETMRALYDESLAHQDYQIGRLVERLRERGEWENTLLIIAADHAIEAALWDLGELMQETVPPRWNYSILRPSVSRVPLIVVWPGHIAGGRRFGTPVSMIDVLPTVLDLAGLPQPDVLQGQSLAPLLRGQPGWTPRPVILDSFTTDTATGQLRGFLEVIDGQWAASLRIGQPPDPAQRRPWPLLLYDLHADPWALHPINEQRPDLVTKYTAFLEEQWKAHRALATRFTPGEKPALTPEQLERLRSLGYIR